VYKRQVNDHTKPGFINGGRGLEEMIKIGVVASTRHPQVRYTSRNDWHGPWAEEPWRCITYDSCHDNHTFWDRLKLGSPRASDAELIRMNKLAAAILLTSQGITFLHAGEEFLRTKYGEENSYNKPDKINRLDWLRCRKYRAVVDYYRGLIALRKARPAFRLKSASQISKCLRFLQMPSRNMVGFMLKHPEETLFVVYSANAANQIVNLPPGAWGVLVDHQRSGAKPFRAVSQRVTLPGRSAFICVHS
jgi:pullulanase